MLQRLLANLLSVPAPSICNRDRQNKEKLNHKETKLLLIEIQGSLIPQACRPLPPTPPLFYHSCILMSEAVDLTGMRGCHKKNWENVMKVIVRIEKTNTITNTWERQSQRQECRRMKNNCSVINCNAILCRELLHIM